MFDRLSERFDDLFRSLRGQGRITERNIDDTLRQIRRSLLEADVNFKVAKDFIQRVKEQALGQDVLKSLTPGQQLVKIVHSELIALLGGSNSPPNLAEHPPPSSCSSASKAVARRLWPPSWPASSRKGAGRRC